MRDVDLVVSVAHVGAVDPEASHSSIEMRAVLMKETARLFKLDNVKIEGSHILVKGQLAEYSVHLGSAVVHQVPGKYLSILPVHSQHRGRLFLPLQMMTRNQLRYYLRYYYWPKITRFRIQPYYPRSKGNMCK
jgi:hypothetical protein